MDSTFTTVVRRIVELLVAGDYDQIALITNGQRLDAESIERAVREYGRKLVVPPIEAFHSLDIVFVQNEIPQKWSIRMNLWSVEEGRSDLSLEMTLIKDDDTYSVELDDLHVL